MPSWRQFKVPMSDGPSPTYWTDNAARAVLQDIFDATVARADPGAAVLRHLPEKPKGRCVVIGASKASVATRLAPPPCAPIGGDRRENFSPRRPWEPCHCCDRRSAQPQDQHF